MTKFVIEASQENPQTNLTEWRQLHPASGSLASFHDKESAERVLNWLYPNNRASVRVSAR